MSEQTKTIPRSPKAEWNPPWSSVLISVLSLIALGAYLVSPISDPQFYFHLTAGDAWIRFGLLKRELLTYLGDGQWWVNTSWVFDVLLAQFEGFFSGSGLAFLALTLTLAAVISTGAVLMPLVQNPVLGFLLTAMVACGALEHWELSPALAAWPLLSFAIYACFSDIGFAIRSVSFLISSMLLANIHSSFFLLPFVVLAVPHGKLKEHLVFLGCFLLSCFLTPFHGREIAQWGAELILEMELAIQFQDSAGMVFHFRFAFLLLLWLLVVLSIPRKEKFQEVEISVFAGVLSLAGLVHKDMLPYAILFVGVILALIWRRALAPTVPSEELSPLLLGLRNVSAGMLRIPKLGAIWLIFCLAFVNVWNSMKMPVVDVFLPRMAIDSFIERDLPGPMIYEPAIAPYIIYRTYFVQRSSGLVALYDDRLPLLVRSLSTAYRSLRSPQPDWGTFFELVHPNTALCKRGSTLFQILERSSSWKIVYEDTLGLNLPETSRDSNPENPEVSSRSQKAIPKNLSWVLFQKIAP